MSKSQAKNHVVGPVDDFIQQVEKRAVQMNSSRKFKNVERYHLIGLAFLEVRDERICNVAKYTFKPKRLLTTLWDSVKDSNCQTIEVDEITLSDLQRLAKIGDNLESSLTEFINFYNESDSLNIILLPEVLQQRSSYTNFTVQLGHTLRKTQIHYPHVQVQYDPSTSRLGVFCRKSQDALSKAKFIDELLEFLEKNKKAFIENDDLPKTYQTNNAMLKHHIMKRTMFEPNIVFQHDGVEVSFLVDKHSKA